MLRSGFKDHRYSNNSCKGLSEKTHKTIAERQSKKKEVWNMDVPLAVKETPPSVLPYSPPIGHPLTHSPPCSEVEIIFEYCKYKFKSLTDLLFEQKNIFHLKSY